MKKTHQTFFALTMCFCQSVSGQGYFVFNNFGSGPPSWFAPVFDSAGTPLEGDSYLAMLYVGPDASSLEPVTSFGNGQIAVVPFVVGGFVSGGIVRAGNVGGGADVRAQMRAWYAPLGATYEEAVQAGKGGYGASSVFQTVSGFETGAGVIPLPLRGLESFSLLPVVPEPGVLSLLLLGVPVLWLAGRQRKRKS